MRRGCLFGVVGLLGVCVVACGLGYLVGLPRFRDELRDPLQEAIGTQIAIQIAPNVGVTPVPGTYVITESDLNEALVAEIGGNDNIDDVGVTLNPDGFTLRFGTRDTDVTYEGNVTAVDGRLEVVDLSSDGWLSFFLPEKDVAKAMEDGVNNYLASSGLRLAAAELGDGTLTLTTEAV